MQRFTTLGISIAFLLAWLLPSGAWGQGIYPDAITIETSNTAVTAETRIEAEALRAERERLEAVEQRLTEREELLDERADALDERADMLDERAEFLREREAALATQVPLEEPVITRPAGPTVEGFFERDAERANRTGEGPDNFTPGTPRSFSPGVGDDDFSPGVRDTEQDFFD